MVAHDEITVNTEKNGAILRVFNFLSINIYKITFIFIVVFVIIISINKICDYDIWWHLKAGEWIVKHKMLPSTDPFSIASDGRKWQVHKWGFHCLLYLIFKIGNFNLLILFKTMIVTITILLMAKLYKLYEIKPALRNWLLFIYTFFTSGYWMVRPQVLEYLFIVILMLIIEKARRIERKCIYLAVLLFLVWVNFHGSFVFGIGLLLFTVILDFAALLIENSIESKNIFIYHSKILFFSVLISLINPYGYKAFVYPFNHYKLHYTLSHIIEWESPHWTEWTGLSIVILLFLSFLSLLFKKNRSKFIIKLYIPLWVAITGILAIGSMKHIPLLFLTALPFLGISFTNILNYNKVLLAKSLQILLIIIIFFLTIFFVRNEGAFSFGIQKNMFPVQAVRFINENQPAPNLFTITQDGGYVLFHLWPAYKVFRDGRLVLLGDETMKAANEIMSGGSHFTELLKKYKINTALIRYRTDTGKLGPGRRFAVDPDWVIVYRDEKFAVYLNNTNQINIRIIQHLLK